MDFAVRSYLGRQCRYLCQIWQVGKHWPYSISFRGPKSKLWQNSRWREPPFPNYANKYISANSWPICTKFSVLLHIGHTTATKGPKCILWKTKMASRFERALPPTQYFRLQLSFTAQWCLLSLCADRHTMVIIIIIIFDFHLKNQTRYSAITYRIIQMAGFQKNKCSSRWRPLTTFTCIVNIQIFTPAFTQTRSIPTCLLYTSPSPRDS